MNNQNATLVVPVTARGGEILTVTVNEMIPGMWEYTITNGADLQAGWDLGFASQQYAFQAAVEYIEDAIK